MEEQLILFFIIGIIITNSLQEVPSNQQSWKESSDSSHETHAVLNHMLTSASQVLRVNVPEAGQRTPLTKTPTYFILASDVVRPSHTFSIIVHIIDADTISSLRKKMTVEATIYRNNIKIAQTSEICHANEIQMMTMKMPATILPGTFKLHVEGSLREMLGVTTFSKETYLHYSAKSLTIIIQLSQLIYHQGQTVNFRIFPFGTDLKAFKEPVDIYMMDPNGNIVQKWLTYRTDSAVANLSFVLPDKVIPGNWMIRVSAQGQTEEKQFIVKEYFSSLFDVQVSLPLFIKDTENHVEGYIQANYTDGGAVLGNLTLMLSVNEPCIGCNVSVMEFFSQRFIPNFEGFHYFRIPVGELYYATSKLAGKQVTVKATVGDPYLDKIIDGYSSAIIKPTDVTIRFLGPQPQIFKPSAPIKIYVGAVHSDGSPISHSYVRKGKVEMRTKLVFKTKQTETLYKQDLSMMLSYPGIWEAELDLMSDTALNRKLNDIKMIKLEASYRHPEHPISFAKVSLFPQISPHNHHLSISTSTKVAKVGEFIVFHVRANFYLLKFSYVVISKGVILTGESEAITSTIRTFAVNITPNMVPRATVVVYYVNLDGDVLAASLTFPVENAMKTMFNVTIRKIEGKLNGGLEFTVKGKPGSYVGLSAVADDWDQLQDDRSFLPSNVYKHMKTFDDNDDADLISHKWKSRDGLVNTIDFPTANHAPDPYKTFKNAGLVVFTDANLTSFIDECDEQRGYFTCLLGKCFTESQHCDGRFDCEDGSDESHCPESSFDVAMWRQLRQKPTRKTFDSTWLWENIIISRRGYTLFNVSFSDKLSNWTMDAFSVGKNKVVSLQSQPLKFEAGKRFYLILNAPSICKQGEQLGLRVTVFNKNPTELLATVNLASSRNYKFIKIAKPEESSLTTTSRRATRKEHQHKVLIKSFSSVTVHIPILFLKLGDINVTVMAQSQLGKDTVVKKITVEAPGLTQYKHASMILDLSNTNYMIKYFDINLTDTADSTFPDNVTFIPGSSKAFLNIYGDVVGPLSLNTPVDTITTLRKPYGCAEQNMFNFAYNMYMLKYMNMTNQRNYQLEKKLLQYLNKVYAEQLSFQTLEGGFKWFHKDDKADVRLTAFCLWILNEGTHDQWSNLLHVDPAVINKAARWLLSHQVPSGAFYDVISKARIDVYKRKVNTDGQEKYVSLTAQVVLAFLFVTSNDAKLQDNIRRSRNLAVNFLERSLPLIGNQTDPYDLALVTYALTLAESQQAEKALKLLGGKSRDIGERMMYWGKDVMPSPKYNTATNKPLLQTRLVDRYDSANILTTAYALLVYVEKDVLLKEDIVSWLTYQRWTSSGWSSTQDTLIAYKALLEYTNKYRNGDGTDISITVDSSSSPRSEKIFNIRNENLAQLQTTEIKKATGNVTLLIKGRGLAVAQLAIQYNVDSPQAQILPPISAFSLVIKMDYAGRNSSRIIVNACQRWLLWNESDTSQMAVLEVEIPTGYIVHQQDLEDYVASKVLKNLKNAKFQKKKVTFYFKFLEREVTCVHFSMDRWLPVANISRMITAKVYDYYSPEWYNETIIFVKPLNMLNICQVCGSYECPPCTLPAGTDIARPATLFLIFIHYFFTFLWYVKDLE